MKQSTRRAAAIWAAILAALLCLLWKFSGERGRVESAGVASAAHRSGAESTPATPKKNESIAGNIISPEPRNLGAGPSGENQTKDEAAFAHLLENPDYCQIQNALRIDGWESWAQPFVSQLFAGASGLSSPLAEDSEFILRALLSASFAEAVSSLQRGKGWRAKAFLGLYLAGGMEGRHAIHQSSPAELRAAITAFDQAIQLEPTNSFLPWRRAIAMEKSGMEISALKKYLRVALGKGTRFESPMVAVLRDFGFLSAVNPQIFSAAQGFRPILPAPNHGEAQAFAIRISREDRPLGALITGLADRWRAERLRFVEENLPEEFALNMEFLLACSLGRMVWPEAYPEDPLPDRFSAEECTAIHKKSVRANLVEIWNYASVSESGTRACDGAWAKGILIDFKNFRDRVHQFDLTTAK